MDLSEKWMFKTGLQRHVKIAMDKAIAHVERNPHLNLGDVLKADVKMETQRFITQERLKKQSFGGYNPGGMAMPNRNIVGDYRYGYQGEYSEKDEETGHHAFELRMYDSRINRRISPDPAGQYASPYMSMGNNWANRVDPDGGEDNPIYGSDGTFRGVDEFGLNGEAIVYDGAFTNGMSQSEILNGGGFFIGDNFNFANGIAGNKIVNHYMNIPNRPDFDGAVTLSEANNWARNGNGNPLYVDIGTLDLSRVSVWGDFSEYDSSTRSFFSKERLSKKNYKLKTSIYKNFALPGAGSGIGQDPGPVFGTIKLTLLNRQTGAVRLGNDKGRIDVYNFEQHKGRHFRNSLTWIGKQLATQVGTSSIQDFEIYGYGKNNVSKGF